MTPKSMHYTPAAPDGVTLFFEIRNSDGMNIGNATTNDSPFEGCKPVTIQDAERNAKLWCAAPELLENLERIIDRLEESELQIYFPSAYERAKSIINKAKGL